MPYKDYSTTVCLQVISAHHTKVIARLCFYRSYQLTIQRL